MAKIGSIWGGETPTALKIFSAVTVFVMTAKSAQSLDQVPPYCNPPLKPLVASETLFAEYEAEIQQEFYDYFDNFSGYVKCLEASRALAFSQAKEVTETYRQVFGNPNNEG